MGKSDPAYKDVHLDFYRDAGIAWPPDLSVASHIDFPANFSRRANEALFFLDQKFPAVLPDDLQTLQGKPILEFVDINTDIKRLMAMDSSGTYKSPWRAHPFTMTGSSKIVVRITTPGRPSVVRQLIGTELFAACGWFPSSFQPDCELPDQELCASLCGNCFSAYHLGPMLLLAAGCVDMQPGAAHFEKQPEAAEEISDDDGD